ncbi:MAG: cytochrome c biogenesis protein CcsA [candidate division NC10 bacterium]|nr:cytochrome c biogenesis protein CcsA [candidate division NC10 bacterium]MBI4840703.1 cytochrome c biogenesis protein CcsA [candidate division NC10 bacterium]
MGRGSLVARILGGAAGLLLATGLYLGLVVVPPDAVQGDVQRIMYVHVPSIVTAYIAFFVVFCTSILYLWKRDLRLDAVAVSSAEIGVVFTGITLATGMIWGKPTWGVWWTWDARLTLTAILFTIYVGYLMLRAFAEEPLAAARYGAVLAILGFLDIPLNHLAVYWWRTLHQPSSILRPGGPSVASAMLLPLAMNFAGLILLFAYFLVERVRLERIRHRTAEVRLTRGRRG